MMSVFHIVITLFTLISTVLANTESLFHFPPFTHIEPVSFVPRSSKAILINEQLHITLDSSSNEDTNNLIYLHITGFDKDEYYNARVSWSALDPVDVTNFGLVEFDDEVYLTFNVESYYEDFTQENYQKVEMIVLVEELLFNVIPKSLTGVVCVVIGSIVTGFVMSRVVYRWLATI